MSSGVRMPTHGCSGVNRARIDWKNSPEKGQSATRVPKLGDIISAHPAR